MNENSFWIHPESEPDSYRGVGPQSCSWTGTRDMAEAFRTNDGNHQHRVVNRLLVDGHVHFHDCYDEEIFLAAAHANLSRHGNGLPTILLAEMNGTNVFARWRSGDSVWSVKNTYEPHSLLLGNRLLVIAGRQIVTAERIEVLALLTSESFDDGLLLDDTIRQIQASGALAVLPWGVGKWLGLRSQRIVIAANQHSVLLGDNAGRPFGWPASSLFRQHVVLPGTDPLRLKSEQRIVGSYGFDLDGTFDLLRPATAVTACLKDLSTSPRPVGHRVGPITFLRQQTSLRLQR